MLDLLLINPARCKKYTPDLNFEKKSRALPLSSAARTLGFIPDLNRACVQGSTNGTSKIPISFKVLSMAPLVKPLVPMVMSMVPLALPMEPLAPLVSQWYHC